MQLSPEQHKIFQKITTIFPSFKIILLKGDPGTGKQTVFQKFISDNDISVTAFNFLDVLQTRSPKTLNSQDIYHYLCGLEVSCKRDTSSKKCICIKDYSTLANIFGDYNNKNRKLFAYVFSMWLRSVESKVFVISSCKNARIEVPDAYCLELSLTEKDTCFFLQKEEPQHVGFLTQLGKHQRPACIQTCLKYARCDIDNFEERYSESLQNILGVPAEMEKDTVEPDPAKELLGMESLMEELHTFIINPVEINHPEMPMCRGIVLCGPPGSGKTSICRWLSYRLQNKFFVVRGETGCGRDMLLSTEYHIDKAAENAPAAVFIDDADQIFSESGNRRAFLTLLDGIGNRKRNNISIIIACNSLSEIPPGIIRGDRLEKCFYLTLPQTTDIRKRLHTRLDITLDILKDIEAQYSDSLHISNIFKKQYTSELVNTLAAVMNGWNYADIKRCIKEVLFKLSKQIRRQEQAMDLQGMIKTVIAEIQQQYTKVPRNIYDNSTSYYV